MTGYNHETWLEVQDNVKFVQLQFQRGQKCGFSKSFDKHLVTDFIAVLGWRLPFRKHDFHSYLYKDKHITYPTRALASGAAGQK